MNELYVVITEVEGKNVSYKIVGGVREQRGMVEEGDAIDLTDILEEAKADAYLEGEKDSI